MEEGYYYLNNFDNILNSFGECGKPRRAVSWVLPWSPQVPGGAEQSCPRPPHPEPFAILSRVLSGPSGACGLPSLGVQCRPDPRACFLLLFQHRGSSRASCLAGRWVQPDAREPAPLSQLHSCRVGPGHTSQTQRPALPRPGPHSSAPGFHGEAGRPDTASQEEGIPSRHPRSTPRKVRGLFPRYLHPWSITSC